jgi:Domain of unknown function DUF11
MHISRANPVGPRSNVALGLLALAGGALLALSGGARAGGSELAPAKACNGKRAVIGHKPMCSKPGNACRRSLARQYRRYGSECQSGRLTRISPRWVDVSIHVSPRNPQVTAGSQVTYKVVVSNAGPRLARHVDIYSDLILNYSVARLQSVPAGCSSYGGSDIECDLGNLAAGAKKKVYVTMAFTGRPGDRFEAFFRPFSLNPRCGGDYCGFSDLNTLNDLGYMFAYFPP